MFNRWYTHWIGLKHLQSETLPQKPQSLISCWKPSSAPKFLLCSVISTVAHKDKTLPRFQNTSHPKTLPRIQNTSQYPKHFPESKTTSGPESKNTSQNPKSHPRIQKKQRLKFVNESKQWINFVERINRTWCWKEESNCAPAVFFLSSGNENFYLTSGKSVNFWVDFLLNAKVYSKKKTKYAYYIIWTYCRKILRAK